MLNVDALKAAYSNEQMLAILLSRLYFGTQKADDVRSFLNKEHINWPLFYKLASNNDIRGFIFDIITVHQIPIDASIHDTLKKDAMGISLIGSHQVDVMRRLKEEFNKAGITVIPYKGITLAKHYYKAPHIREGSDIDLLIKQDDLPQIIKLLHEKGYEARYKIAPQHMGFVLRHHRELSFKSPKDRMGITCSVEIQWNLLDKYQGHFHQYDFFVRHLQDYNAVDGTVQTGLAPTYDFLCVATHHLIREPLLRFKYLIDLACIIQTSSDQLDWKVIDKQFVSHNKSAFLWSGLNALQDIIGLQLPLSPPQAVPYHLFTATALRSGRALFEKKIRLVTSKQSFLGKIKYRTKSLLFLMLPNQHDLSGKNVHAWQIPLIVPVKMFRFILSGQLRKP